MKILLSLLLFTGCTGLGFVYANQFRSRAELLTSMMAAWRSLQARIVFFADPLHHALSQCAALLDRGAASLFAKLGEAIGQTGDLGSAMEQALARAQKVEPELAVLNGKDREALVFFALRLGADSITQQSAFEWLDSYLADAIQTARTAQRTKSRLYRASGPLIGLMLVVLFL
jgi:stage III sporulation protein AB